ncbi:MAG: hypothetical protein A3C11_02430 [Candidatus Sungbacteria bacterium RIFCSPHIGHO2_02_FULL_49_12]|uniref:Uncharacterized protein n=1 Tax=Candidatus Sungbacteria bacterium RIFCSPHIGHO2_02_FULL_49_12 TaxID=1802271 RepID=A0A1G2KQ68_9BACT|nr:MAG: hypothetical protein A3C11_02430 [Candidatus Sungbacteria bacterium RIFCSPHIGHO2_02_FULL_49_12]
MKPQHIWYRGLMDKNKEQLRESLYISDIEYPFPAIIAVSDNSVLLCEYKTNPFALLIFNSAFAEAMASIHKIVWERYRA